MPPSISFGIIPATMTRRNLAAGGALAVLVLLSIAIYIRAGLGGAFLAEDDFQWLDTGYTFQGLPLPDGGGFYRPVVTVWFAAATRLCGPAPPCYHALSLAIHVVNVGLAFLLVLALGRDVRVAALTGLLFALEPAYVQAVVWVSATTELLSALFFLASLTLQVRSWHAATPRTRTLCEVGAVACFGAALLSHEAAAMLPAVAWFMWREFGAVPLARRRLLAGGLLVMLAAFAAVTLAANYRNPVFTGSSYRFGVHMVRHGLDYLVGMYVGPVSLGAYLACVAVLCGFVILRSLTRFGAVWLLVTLVPYVGFTWDNISRYSYVPSVGFALAVTAAIIAGIDGLAARFRWRRAVGTALLVLATLFIFVRFSRFYAASIQSQVLWLDAWRDHVADVRSQIGPAPVGGRVYLDAERLPVEPRFVGPLVRWAYQDYTLDVIVE